MDKQSQTKEIIELYGKIFLFAAISFGLLMELSQNILHLIFWRGDTFFKPSLDFGWGLLSGVFFGAAMSLLWGTMHITTVRGLPFGKQPGALQVRQTRSIELKLPYDQIFNLCLEIILIRGGTIQLQNPKQGKIVARRGVTIINLDVSKLNDGTSMVTISSKPAVLIALVDLGNNLGNVNNIAAFLQLKEQQALKAVV